MKMFYWTSEALARYSRGYIIVMAETVEEAKKKVIVRFDAHLRKTYDWWFDSEDKIYDDHLEQYTHQKKNLEYDLSLTPYEFDVLFIPGSE